MKRSRIELLKKLKINTANAGLACGAMKPVGTADQYDISGDQPQYAFDFQMGELKLYCVATDIRFGEYSVQGYSSKKMQDFRMAPVGTRLDMTRKEYNSHLQFNFWFYQADGDCDAVNEYLKSREDSRRVNPKLGSTSDASRFSFKLPNRYRDILIAAPAEKPNGYEVL